MGKKMKSPIKLLAAAGLFSFVTGVCGVLSEHEVMLKAFKPFQKSLNLQTNSSWNYDDENTFAEAWTNAELSGGVKEIYSYAMREMEKFCGLSGFFSTIINCCPLRACGFGSVYFFVGDGGIPGTGAKITADQLGDAKEISFSMRYGDNPFTAFLIHENCLKWVEKGNGMHLLVPLGIPSKKKLKKLYQKYEENNYEELMQFYSEEEDCVSALDDIVFWKRRGEQYIADLGSRVINGVLQ